MRSIQALSAAALASLVGAVSHADTLYNITDLTPAGYHSSVAYDINSDGDAVGVATSVSGEAYFYYDHSTGLSTVFGVGVVTPRGAIVGTGFREAAINDDGLVAGSARFLAGATETRGFIYNGTSFTNLGTLAGAPGTGIRPASDALDLNGLGVATGTATSGAGTTPQESDNIDVYTGSMSPITDIDGDLTTATRYDYGRAINDAGFVAGQNQDTKATLFTAGGAETILLAGTSEAGDNSVAYDLNESNDVVGENITDNSSFIYDGTTGGVTFIPQIGTGNRMFAKAINEDGDAVGQGDRDTGLSGQARGFLYDASEGTSLILEDRTVYTGSDTVGLSDWLELGTAWGINDDGWIVGQGERRFDGNGFPNQRAYLLIPEDFGTGDYNASGQVEQADLDLVLQNWGDDTTAVGIPAGWINDQPVGLVDQAELDKVLLNWGATSAPSFTGGTVPEPATLMLLMAGGVWTARCRQR